jgi:uncharacterized protein (DUF433 family)
MVGGRWLPLFCRHSVPYLHIDAMALKEFAHSDPEILGGTLVFAGTRVPVRILIDYLEGGESLDEFLDNYPSVSREQALAAASQLNI